MTPQLVLEIIKLSLEITLEIIRGIPLKDRQDMWEAHEKRLEFWQTLFTTLNAQERR